MTTMCLTSVQSIKGCFIYILSLGQLVSLFNLADNISHVWPAKQETPETKYNISCVVLNTLIQYSTVTDTAYLHHNEGFRQFLSIVILWLQCRKLNLAAV